MTLDLNMAVWKPWNSYIENTQREEQNWLVLVLHLDNTLKLIPKSQPTFQNFSNENFEFRKIP